MARTLRENRRIRHQVGARDAFPCSSLPTANGDADAAKLVVGRRGGVFSVVG